MMSAFSTRRPSGPTIERPITKINVTRRSPPMIARKVESERASAMSSWVSARSSSRSTRASAAAALHSARLFSRVVNRSAEGNDEIASVMNESVSVPPSDWMSCARARASIWASWLADGDCTGARYGRSPLVSVSVDATSRKVRAEPNEETRLRTDVVLRSERFFSSSQASSCCCEAA